MCFLFRIGEFGWASSPKSGAEELDGAKQSSKKGRRNIRALMSDDLLAEDTQLAREEELERISRLKNRKKITDTLSQNIASQSDDGINLLVLDIDKKTNKPLIEVNTKLTKRLKPHQVEGVQFMWDACFESVSRLKKDRGSGCILAHCMGLGKTFQVCNYF